MPTQSATTKYVKYSGGRTTTLEPRGLGGYTITFHDGSGHPVRQDAGDRLIRRWMDEAVTVGEHVRMYDQRGVSEPKMLSSGRAVWVPRTK